jgi:hypothetical protein
MKLFLILVCCWKREAGGGNRLFGGPVLGVPNYSGDFIDWLVTQITERISSVHRMDRIPKGGLKSERSDGQIPYALHLHATMSSGVGNDKTPYEVIPIYA